jgi:cytochrome c oxidase subunit II
MPFHPRPRRPITAALTVALLGLAAGCQSYPNSIFHNRTDFNRDVIWLFNLTLILGVLVFIFVEGLLIWTMIKYRARPGQPDPEHVHGNATLEITWTVLPALILLVIAIPTVKTIFRTEGRAPQANALHVHVIGHQWWWEFQYPDYGITTANELYLPIGRTAEFELSSADVIHSFWVPALGGKRDVIPDRTNYLWFTPDSSGSDAFNGVCAEYCGTSHANMRFRTYTVSAADFDAWVKNQQATAAMVPPQPAPPPTVPTPQPGAAGAAPAKAAAPAPAPVVVGLAPSANAMPVTQAGFTQFPLDKIPEYARPNTPIPKGLTFDESLKGDPLNGAKLMMGVGTCYACHMIKGNPVMVGQIGPNLTHIASRSTIGAALYPNNAKYLGLWIKNVRLMKPGINTMPTLGAGQYDPTAKMTLPAGAGLTDQQIADIVAYLQLLK